MLEPPELPIEQIATCVQSAYNLSVSEVSFLPIGADLDTAVYRVVADDATPYFLKLRRGVLFEASVAIPHWFATEGLQHLVPPLATHTTGALWTQLPPFTVSLYPFINGRSGWNVALFEQQWVEFGATLHAIHTAAVPSALLRTVPRETYTAHWRNRVAAFLEQAARHSFDDPVAQNLARLLQAKRNIIWHVLTRAEQLANALTQQAPDECLCHGDIHAGNILVDDADQLYLVDWDTLVVAPKEHDLMFIGGGVGRIWNNAQEAAWFYQAYGQTTINLAALTYYRYERIVQDIAVTCEQLLETSEGGNDRAVALNQLQSQFEPNDVVDIAYTTDETLRLSS